jgi:hypothetical protein
VAEPEVKADDKKLPDGDSKAKVKPGLLEGKKKIWIYGLGGVALVVVFLMMKSKSSAATTAAATPAASAATNIDPATGYAYGSPADVAALGGSGATTAAGSYGSAGDSGSSGAAGSAGAQGATGAAGATGATGNGLIALTYAQAQKLAGKAGSSSLYYSGSNTNGVVQGKYANDKAVSYYTTPAAALKVGATIPK